MEKQETFEEMTARFNNDQKTFICTEALKIFHCEAMEMSADELRNYSNQRLPGELAEYKPRLLDGEVRQENG